MVSYMQELHLGKKNIQRFFALWSASDICDVEMRDPELWHVCWWVAQSVPQDWRQMSQKFSRCNSAV